MKCQNCGIELESKRTDAKFCSPNCRVTFSRKASIVTDNVTFSEPAVTDNFEFYTRTVGRKTDMGTIPAEKSDVRKAQYWYDVPIAAIPVIRKGWPEMPEGMNGRQYFLWWKNEFKMNDKFPDSPEILNPYPEYTELKYFNAGDNSRRWGA